MGLPQLVPHRLREGGFDNVGPGIGFDAWRRVVIPAGPTSEAELHRMHKEVHSPSASRRLGDVMNDLDQWESKLNKYYRCGERRCPTAQKLSSPWACCR